MIAGNPQTVDSSSCFSFWTNQPKINDRRAVFDQLTLAT